MAVGEPAAARRDVLQHLHVHSYIAARLAGAENTDAVASGCRCAWMTTTGSPYGRSRTGRPCDPPHGAHPDNVEVGLSAHGAPLPVENLTRVPTTVKASAANELARQVGCEAVSSSSPWSVPVGAASAETLRFMRKYRQRMDERGITTHLLWLMEQRQALLGAAGLDLKYDDHLAASRQPDGSTRNYGGESVHGADYAVWLRGGGLSLGLRLQAKRLFPDKKSLGNYASLDHEVGKAKTQQSKLLISRTPSSMVPGYIFYNGLEAWPRNGHHLTACCGGRSRTLSSLGLTVAHAQVIRDMLEVNAKDLSARRFMKNCVPAVCVTDCYVARQHFVIPVVGLSLNRPETLPLSALLTLLRAPRPELRPRSIPIPIFHTAGTPLPFLLEVLRQADIVEIRDGEEIPAYVNAIGSEQGLDLAEPRDGDQRLTDRERPADVVVSMTARQVDDRG